MTLKSAAFLALIGMILLTIILVVSLINTILGVARDVIPAITLLTSIIRVFASITVLEFFLVFYRAQS